MSKKDDKSLVSILFGVHAYGQKAACLPSITTKNTTASGDYSIAMGTATEANGKYSTTMGGLTTANGDFSTAMGYTTVADGITSTAMGHYTYAG